MPGYFATAARGTEDLCAAELRALGAAAVEQRPGGVAFEGPEDLGLRACLWLRTAMRVFLPIAWFDAPSPEALYECVKQIPWTDHLTNRHTFAVEATLRRALLGDHNRFVALKTKDAIADAMRALTGARPDVNAHNPDVQVVVHVDGEHATLYLDLAGRPLNQRGYRVEDTEAPLKETLAAALVLASGWDPRAPLCDPMCGSGTIAIEAALLSMDRAPARNRELGAERWPSFGDASRTALRLLHEEADARARPAPAGPILLSDWHEDSVAASLANVRAAGLEHILRPGRRDARELAPLSPPGWIVTNPPYGERLGQSRYLQLAGLYRGLGERWSGFFGHTLAVLALREGGASGPESDLASSADFEREFGMEPVSRRPIFNGPLRCNLLTYRVGEALRRGHGRR